MAVRNAQVRNALEEWPSYDGEARGSNAVSTMRAYAGRSAVLIASCASFVKADVLRTRGLGAALGISVMSPSLVPFKTMSRHSRGTILRA